MSKPYIVYDGNGNPTNGKYPPDREKYGEEFCGYRSEAEKVLFYDFAVMSMDVSFLHDGTRCFFYVHNTPATAYNATRKEIVAEYQNELV